MDFLDPVKKRHHKIRLIVGYFLMAIIVLGVLYIFMLQSYGYDIDRRTGQIIQNGLVFVASHPVSADVYVNNEHKGTTTVKLTIPEGNYNIVLKSPGYRDWKTTINLAGGGVEQLVYPLLVPNKLVTTDAQLYANTPVLASLSPDRHWLLVQRPGSLLDFDLFDLTQATTPSTKLSLPAKVLKTTKASQSLKAIEWSDDSKHLLLRHDYKGGNEFVVLDRENPANSYNVNRLLDTAPSSVVLRNEKYNQLYAYIAKTKSLLSIDSSGNQISPILHDVIDYKTFGSNTVLYTSQVSKISGQYSVNIWDGQKSYLLHNYPAKTAYRLDMATYNNQTYVAVAPVVKNKLYVFKNPLPVMKAGHVPNPFIAIKTINPQFVSFSQDSQFVIAQSGSSFASYDFDGALWHYFSLKDKVGLADEALWIDNDRLSLNINNQISMFDFNGGNQQSLAASATGFNGFFNSNYNSLYTIAPSVQVPKRIALTRTSLVVKK